MSMNDAQYSASRYDTGTRVLVWERGRLAMGEIIALDETYREAMYGIRFSERRKLMFRASEVITYRRERHDTLNAAMQAIFAAFRDEDETHRRAR